MDSVVIDELPTAPVKDTPHAFGQATVVMTDGRVIGFRASTGGDAAMSLAESSDGGMTWDTRPLTGIVGRAPAALRLSDGRIALVYCDDRMPRPGVRLRLLDADGQCMSVTPEIPVRDGRLFDNGRKDLRFEAPTLTEIDAGRLLVVCSVAGADSTSDSNSDMSTGTGTEESVRRQEGIFIKL